MTPTLAPAATLHLAAILAALLLRVMMIGVFIGSVGAAIGALLPGRYLHGLFFG